mgnify:CR=1 FL=1
MASFVIEGGHKLHGEIVPQGAKNEVLQVLCAFIISVGDIIIDVRVELLKKFENKGDSRSAVHVIISIHQDTLFSSHGQV